MIDLGSPKVMGIINATPDSFFASSRKTTVKDVLKSAEKMILEGADIIDLGAYSSRPGAEFVDERWVLIPRVIIFLFTRFLHSLQLTNN